VNRFPERFSQRAIPLPDNILSPDELRLLDLAYRWAPFGGPPPEDIFVELGMDSRTFWRNLETAVRQAPRDQLSDDRRKTLRTLYGDVKEVAPMT
jgi:hypothetical protein